MQGYTLLYVSNTQFMDFLHQEKEGRTSLLSLNDFHWDKQMHSAQIHTVIALKFVYVLALYGPAGEELTTEPPRMQPGLGPSVHMELKNLLRHRQGGQANNTGACEDLLFSLKWGLRHFTIYVHLNSICP